jgi:formylglycine-generating enzyme required for sulfatase activity
MDYPITGISYKQVLAYIAWRNTIIDKTDNALICRLPSPSEWEMIARLSFEKLVKAYKSQEQEYKQIYIETGRNLHGCLLINIRNDKPCENDKNYADRESLEGLFKTNSFYENGLGLLTLQGNVSEMTSEKGVSVGGNYNLPMEQARFDSKQLYSKPESWLGFRCVAQRK